MNQITRVNLEDNQFDIEAYMWFRWDPSQWPPMTETETMTGRTGTARVYPHQTFEIIGSSNVSIEMNGLSPGLAVTRVRATLNQRLDLTRYPFDDHVLAIAIEDIEKTPEIVLVPDTAGSRIGPDVFVNGWEIDQLTATPSLTTYRTNFGDMYLDAKTETVYSRVTFGIPIRRAGDGLFWKSYIGLLIAVAVSLLSFLVPIKKLEPRLGLNVGSLFAAVGSQWIIGENLPDIAAWTLSDRLHALGYGTILLSLGLSVFRVWQRSPSSDQAFDRGRRIDMGFTLGALLTWVIVLFWVN